MPVTAPASPIRFEIRPEIRERVRGSGGTILVVVSEAKLLAFRMGALDEDPAIHPSVHQFTAYAPPWAPVPDDGLPTFPERFPGWSAHSAADLEVPPAGAIRAEGRAGRQSGS